MADLKNYVCTYPFKYMDIQENTAWMCCPSWITENLGDFTNDLNPDLLSLWAGDSAEKIRNSVTDGSYKFCKKNVCPHLNDVVNNNRPAGPIVTRDKFEKMKIPKTPSQILFGFDRACNLKCPSCRSDIVVNDHNDSIERQRKENIVAYVDEHFSENIEKILITGSGDPIYSKVFREYLQNFNGNKYPNLAMVQLITNGNLLNEKMWESLGAKDFIKFIEISVDAGTKDTYENVTRLNGDWDKLIENIKFLLAQPEIEQMVFSMVVSEYNYTEMFDFYNTISQLEKEYASDVKTRVQYMKIQHWGTGKYLPEDIRNISIFDSDHPKFDSFVAELNKVKGFHNVRHNFHEVNT